MGLAVNISRHVFRGGADLPLVLDLIRAMPAACRHVLDFGWRLAAPAIADGRDAVYWQDADGRVVGLAAWQQAWATLDFYIRPGPDAVSVERDIFAWAGERFRERDAERSHPLPYAVEFREDDHDRRALVAAHGFVGNARPSHVYLRCELGMPPSPQPVPDGFSIRPLAGVTEAAPYAEVHRATFGSELMTAQWRERTIGTPLYRPDLDLVAVAPDGALVAFCVGWHDPARGLAQIEPAGVRLHVESADIDATGRVEACEPPRRLLVTTRETDESYRRGQGAPPYDEAIEATLTADDDQTILVIEVRGMPLDKIAFYGTGWQIHAETLAAYLAGRASGDAGARWDELVPAYQDLAASIS